MLSNLHFKKFNVTVGFTIKRQKKEEAEQDNGATCVGA